MKRTPPDLRAPPTDLQLELLARLPGTQEVVSGWLGCGQGSVSRMLRGLRERGLAARGVRSSRGLAHWGPHVWHRTTAGDAVVAGDPEALRRAMWPTRAEHLIDLQVVRADLAERPPGPRRAARIARLDDRIDRLRSHAG